MLLTVANHSADGDRRGSAAYFHASLSAVRCRFTSRSRTSRVYPRRICVIKARPAGGLSFSACVPKSCQKLACEEPVWTLRSLAPYPSKFDCQSHFSESAFQPLFASLLPFARQMVLLVMLTVLYAAGCEAVDIVSACSAWSADAGGSDGRSGAKPFHGRGAVATVISRRRWRCWMSRGKVYRQERRSTRRAIG